MYIFVPVKGTGSHRVAEKGCSLFPGRLPKMGKAIVFLGLVDEKEKNRRATGQGRKEEGSFVLLGRRMDGVGGRRPPRVYKLVTRTLMPFEVVKLMPALMLGRKPGSGVNWYLRSRWQKMIDDSVSAKVMPMQVRDP
jgi:hypothetical protein